MRKAFLFIAIILCVSANSVFAQDGSSDSGDQSGVTENFKNLKRPEGSLEKAGLIGDFNLGAVSSDASENNNRSDFFVGTNPLLPKAPSACEGGHCGMEDQPLHLDSESGVPANVSIPSPMGNMFDSLESKKLKDNIAYVWPLSPISLALTTWKYQSSVTAEGMGRAMELGAQLSANRYLAEQNVRDNLRDSGEQGKVLLQGYQSCVSRLTEGGTNFAAAQEACLGGWDRTMTGIAGTGVVSAQLNENVTSADALSFATHPAHPLYKSKTGAVPFFDNQTILGARSGSDPSRIRLTDILFNPPLIKLGIDQSGASSIVTSVAGDPKAEAIMKLREDWLSLFGDVVWEYRKKIDVSSFAGVRSSREAPLFDYAAAMNKLGISVGQPFPGMPPAAFQQFMRYKTDVVYTNLMNVMYKYCRSGSSNSPANFWVPTEDGNNGKNISYLEVQLASTKFMTFNKMLGDDLFRTIVGKTMSASWTDPNADYCAKLNPFEKDSLGSIDTVMKMSSKDGNPGEMATAVVSFVYKFSQDIATAQINEMLNEARKMAMNLSGGSLESIARQEALTLISDAAGHEWNYENALSTIIAEIDRDKRIFEYYGKGGS